MKEELRMTMALGGGFGLTFLCYLTLETLLTTLMKSREDLSEEIGFASLSSVYLAFAISSVTCHVLCEKIGLKGAILVGVLLYSIWAAIMALVFHLS
jgi:fucose permease